MPQYNIKNSIGSIVDTIDAIHEFEAMRQFMDARDWPPSYLTRLGYTAVPQYGTETPAVQMSPEPKNGEIWQTKAGNIVLIVTRPAAEGPEMGFIWFCEIDKDICYATLMNQLSHKLNMSINEWGMNMHVLMSGFKLVIAT